VLIVYARGTDQRGDNQLSAAGAIEPVLVMITALEESVVYTITSLHFSTSSNASLLDISNSVWTADGVRASTAKLNVRD
jgi:hypothetical protein